MTPVVVMLTITSLPVFEMTLRSTQNGRVVFVVFVSGKVVSAGLISVTVATGKGQIKRDLISVIL